MKVSELVTQLLKQDQKAEVLLYVVDYYDGLDYAINPKDVVIRKTSSSSNEIKYGNMDDIKAGTVLVGEKRTKKGKKEWDKADYDSKPDWMKR